MVGVRRILEGRADGIRQRRRARVVERATASPESAVGPELPNMFARDQPRTEYRQKSPLDRHIEGEREMVQEFTCAMSR